MLLNRGIGEDSWESLGLQGDPTSPSKGNQSWIFIGRTDAEAETPTLATWCEELTYLKRPWCWERLKVGGEGDNRDWLNGHEFGYIQGVGDGQGGLACCSPWGHKESDMTEQLNWTEWVLLCFNLHLPMSNSIKHFNSPNTSGLNELLWSILESWNHCSSIRFNL